MDLDERTQIIDPLYRLVDSLDMKPFSELGDNWQAVISDLTKKVSELDPSTREHLTGAIGALVSLDCHQLRWEAGDSDVFTPSRS